MTDPLTTVGLGLGSLALVVTMMVIATRWGRGGVDVDPESAGLDREITELEQRLVELEEPSAPRSWLTNLVTWRTRRKLAELLKRRQRYEKVRQRWEARAKGVVTATDHTTRKVGIQPPPVRSDHYQP